MKQTLILLVGLGVIGACDELKQALGEVVVSVENRATLGGQPLSGIAIIANGETKFTLGASEKKSFSVRGISTGSIRVLARHEALPSDLAFTVLTPGSSGGSAAIIISTEILLGSEVVVMRCPGCESLFSQQSGSARPETSNPIR